MRKETAQNTTLGSKTMSGAQSIFSETITSVIQRKYARMRNGAKVLARHGDASVAAAQHWIYGRRVPSVENLMNIMTHCEEMAVAFQAEVESRRAKTE